MADLPRDPWQTVTTYHGFKADHVISALQKEIRRGNSENAALLAYEMILTSAPLEDYLWQRLMVISVEDIGLGQPNAPLMINALYQMLGTFDRSVGERKLFAVHAVRYLCQCPKDRSSDEMVNWLIHGVSTGTLRPIITSLAAAIRLKPTVASSMRA
ncbi:MAG: AAA family ATPase [Chloroflexota bacterium]